VQEYEKFWGYIVFNDDRIVGIAQDAPKEIKEQYRKYLLREKELLKKHIKV
jgi:hypothetical protein